MRVLIIGGGIGGLTAAVALSKVGLDAVVHERAPELLEVGAGLTLWPNATRVLRQLGLSEAIETASAPLTLSEIRQSDGRLLAELDLGAISKRVGAPTLGIHRAELQRVLADAVGPRLKLGMACTALHVDETGVTARFANGWQERGDLLIGADGLRSVVRTELFGSQRPRYAGYTAWRGVARLSGSELPPEKTLLVLGRGAHFGCLPIGGHWYYWFLAANEPEGGRDPGGASRALLLRRYADWDPAVCAVIAATRTESILRNDIFDRPPTRLWGRGRITLVGDAAHPTTPILGQGACQAIEDAFVLARCLGKARDPVAGLRYYEELRYERTALITNKSWRLGRILAIESRFWCWLRNKWLANSSRLMLNDTEAIVRVEV